MPARLKFPLERHGQKGWRTCPPLHEQAHVEVDMRFNGPTPDGPVVEEWVFEEKNSIFDCVSWLWNWGKRRRQAEQIRSKTIISKMCSNMEDKASNTAKRVHAPRL